MARRIPFRLPRFVHGEFRVDGANGVIEFLQQNIRIIQRSVLKNIRFRGLQNPDAVRLRVQLVNIADLLCGFASKDLLPINHRRFSDSENGQ